VLENYGRSSALLFAERDLLEGKTVLSYELETTDEDIRILAEHGASLSHCPISDLADVTSVPRCLKIGVEVVLGTDLDSADIWEVMRVALPAQGSLGRARRRDGLPRGDHRGREGLRGRRPHREELLPTVGLESFSNRLPTTY